MKTHDDLKTILRRIDRRGYNAYKEIQGIYQFNDFTLIIDHVQGDYFAESSRIRARVGQSVAGFPADTYQSKSREVGLRDYLTRQFHRAIRDVSHRKQRGTGKSGLIETDAPGQEILLRTSCLINERFVEVRFKMGLPAAGRSILGGEAVEMFCNELPKIVTRALFFKNLDPQLLYQHNSFHGVHH